MLVDTKNGVERESNQMVSLQHQLSPRHCGPFELLERIGLVGYRIAFPTNTRAHNAFHVSLIKEYVHDHNHVIDRNVI